MKRTPWKYDETYGLIVEQDGTEIGASHSNLENGRIMAAGPQMLQTLQSVRDYLLYKSNDCFDTSCNCEGNEEPKALMDAIEAAIKQAGAK